MKGRKKSFKSINSENSSDSNQNDYCYTEVHTYPPFYDFKLADKSYGVDFSVFSEDGFNDFLKDKYLTILVDLRKSYHKKDIKMVKEWAHKIKGAFVYLNSPFVSESANLLMKAAMEGRIDSLEDLYVDLLVKLNIFLEKLMELGKKIDNPLNNEFIQKYVKVNYELDSRETQETKNKFVLNVQKIKDSLVEVKEPIEVKVNSPKVKVKNEQFSKPIINCNEETTKVTNHESEKTPTSTPQYNIQVHNIQNNYSINYNNIGNNEAICFEKEDMKGKSCCNPTGCLIY